jgi:NADPH-dependent F420 reductase
MQQQGSQAMQEYTDPEARSIETIAIIGGTGNLGFGLSVRLALAGFSVCIGSRDGKRAEEAATRAQGLVPHGNVTGCANPEAAAMAERLVVVTVPFASQVATLKGLTEAWRAEHVVLDGTVPLATAVGGRPTQLIQPWAGSAAEQARSVLPDHVQLVSGLHTISAAALTDLDEPLAQDTLICGNSAPAKAMVKEVIGSIDGLRVVDAGPLAASRLVEGITPLLIGINIRNKTHAGIQLTNLPA